MYMYWYCFCVFDSAHGVSPIVLMSYEHYACYLDS